jgi:hypothetical protein
MATPKRERLLIDAKIAPHLARQIVGLGKWFKEYAEENLPNEELVPGEDGLPENSAPELDEVEKIEQIQVLEATDIGKGHLSLKCRVRLVITVSLNDPEETVVTIRHTWEMYLLVEPGSQLVLEHSHGWDGGWLPDA